MERRQRSAYQGHVNALNFLRREKLDVGPVGRLAQEYGACVKRISALAVEQATRTMWRGGRPSPPLLRRKLRREHMLGIARVARVELKNEPGMKALTLVPHGRKTSVVMILAAEAMARAVSEHKAAFRGKLAPDFLRQLRAAIRDLKHAERVGAQAAQRYPRATLELKGEVRRARDLNAAIHGLLIPHFNAHPALETEWVAASRVGARLGRPRKKKRKGGDASA